MQLVALTDLLLLFQPIAVLTTTTDTNNMDKDKPNAVPSDDKDPINMTLVGSGDDKEPSLTCGDSTPDLGVACDNLSDRVKGSNGDGDDTAMEEKMGKNEKKKKRAVRATLYTARYDGKLYHVPIHSSLGEAYRNLVTKTERLEFMIERGLAQPYRSRCCYRPAPETKEKKTSPVAKGVSQATISPDGQFNNEKRGL